MGGGLCSCCTDCVPNLLMAWCCPRISLAQVYARLELYRYLRALVSLFVLYVVGLIGDFIPSGTTETATYTYDPDTGYVVASAPLASMMLLWITMVVSQSLFRLVVWEARFQIPGSCIGDDCVSCLCSCCAIAQLASHAKSYTPAAAASAPRVCCHRFHKNASIRSHTDSRPHEPLRCIDLQLTCNWYFPNHLFYFYQLKLEYIQELSLLHASVNLSH